ncbi:MAG: glutathione ABC transporter permease GsiD, partial [Symbiopectobacterium sp.]
MSHSTEPTMTAAAQDNDAIRSPMRDFWQAFIQNPLALVSGGFILLLVLVAAFAPWLAPFNPMDPDWMALSAPPSATHWMGTDDLGRDVMSRIIYGSRISLYIGLFSVTLGMVVGIVLGLLAGFYGRWIDMLIMRSADVLFAFPGMLLAIAVVAILGPGLNNVIIAVAVFSV